MDRLLGPDTLAGRIATLEVPLVCPNCSLVHRVLGAAFASPHVTCPSCGFARASGELVAKLPRNLTLLPASRKLPAFTEFPIGQ